MIEKWICWIPPINKIFKLNFNDSKIQNENILKWVIRDSNHAVKMVASRHISNALIIIA